MHQKIKKDDEPAKEPPPVHPMYLTTLAEVEAEMRGRVELCYASEAEIAREVNRRIADYERHMAAAELWRAKGRWHVAHVIRSPAQV